MKLQKVLSEKKEIQRLYTIESGAVLRAAAKKMIGAGTDYLMVRAKDTEPPEFIEQPVEGGLTIKAAIVPVILEYVSDSNLT